MSYEYFRIGSAHVWHIAPAFSHLPLPTRNAGKSLCGYAVAKRMDSAPAPRGDLCEKCASRVQPSLSY